MCRVSHFHHRAGVVGVSQPVCRFDVPRPALLSWRRAFGFEERLRRGGHLFLEVCLMVFHFGEGFTGQAAWQLPTT